MEEFIQSRQNPRIKALSRLQERSGRKKFNKFAIEGLRELSRAILAGIELEEIYYCPELFKSAEHSRFIEENKGKFNCCRLSDSAFEKISNREGSDGIIAIAEQWHTKLSEIGLPLDKPALILVADAIEKPGNLGALLRSADAVAADAVILTNSVSDIFNPSVVRTSQGAVFSLKIAEAGVDELFAWLEKNKINSYAAELGASKYPWVCDFKKPTAIIMGCEKNGLPQDYIAKCSEKIKLPMQGSADSLNVNIAASVLLFEAVRQRLS